MKLMINYIFHFPIILSIVNIIQKLLDSKNIESQLSFIYKEDYELKKDVENGIFKIEITIPAR